jgi:4-hydroxyphenylpyruvate dioxygenase
MENRKRNNPCGLDGFAFLEFSAPDPSLLKRLFLTMGFHPSEQHLNHEITRYRQGDIEFILNATENSQAQAHATSHGPGACAMGFKVHNAQKAYDHAIIKGAEPFLDEHDAHHGLLAIQAIGGSVIYFVDADHPPFKDQWKSLPPTRSKGAGLMYIDHLTHNVYRGNMDKWADFYQSIFNFHEIRFFDIKGKASGLISRALSSPCEKIKIPLNESKDDVSQIEEFLHEYNGEGIQHIALNTSTIYETVHQLRENGVSFLDVPDTYYDMIEQRIPWHKEPLELLKQERLLIDGEQDPSKGLLLQLFTQNVFGPVFFEIIQRQGNEGFGEGNFTALFEAIERDQMNRGVL